MTLDTLTALRLCLASSRRATAQGLRGLAEGRLEAMAPLLRVLDAEPEAAPLAATVRALTPEAARMLLAAHPELGQARRGGAIERRDERLWVSASSREVDAVVAEAGRRGVSVSDLLRSLLATIPGWAVS